MPVHVQARPGARRAVGDVGFGEAGNHTDVRRLGDVDAADADADAAVRLKRVSCLCVSMRVCVCVCVCV